MEPNVPDHSVDMIVIANAAQWFDWDKPDHIWQTLTAKLRPGGTLFVLGSRLSPGRCLSGQALETHPLRQLFASIQVEGPFSKYYTTHQARLATSLYSTLPMPWNTNDSDLGAMWRKHSRLYLGFDLCNDVTFSDKTLIIPESDCFPKWLSSYILNQTCNQVQCGASADAAKIHITKATPRQLAEWVRRVD